MKKILLLSLLTLSFKVFANENKIQAFATLSPAGSFEITSTQVRSTITKTNGQFRASKIVVPIASLKTGMKLRDSHLKEHLNPSNKHSRITLSDIKSVSPDKGTGQLEVNGVKVPIQFTYKDKKGYVEAEFEVKASSFKLKKAAYMGVGVNDVVKVKAQLRYTEK